VSRHLLKEKEISLPVTTNALTHALSILGYLFINKNEKIILPDLFWGNYKHLFVQGYNAVLDTFQTFKNNEFNISGLKEKLNSKGEKKILLLNFPNNPSGYTPTIKEAKQIIETIKVAAENDKKILVICDDAYFGLVYKEGIEKQSLFSYLADLHENVLTVKVDGATKEDYVWGFRTGFITYATKNSTNDLFTALEAKTAGAIRGTISNAPNISQSLLLKAFSSSSYKKEKESKYALLKSRYKRVVEILKEKKYTKYFSPVPFNSGYFMCIRLNENLDTEEIRQLLLKKYSTGVIAINNLLRIAFSSVAESKLEKLFENIYNSCQDSLNK
jgi:aspartate/methionine/tyrosine aminotransferase